MDHEELRDKLWTLNDGEANPAERAELRAHLAGCAECRAEAENWRRVRAAFLRPAPAPGRGATEAFTRRVMARLQDELAPETAAPWNILNLRWLVPAASFALAVSLALIMWPGQDYSEPASALLENSAPHPNGTTADQMLGLALGEI